MTVTKKTAAKPAAKPAAKATAKPAAKATAKPAAKATAASKARLASAEHNLQLAGWNYAGSTDAALQALKDAATCKLSNALASRAFIRGHMARRLFPKAKTADAAIARVIAAWAKTKDAASDVYKAYASARKALSRVRAANTLPTVQKRTKQPKPGANMPSAAPKPKESPADIIATVPVVRELGALKAELAKHIVAITALPKKNAKVADMAFNLVCNQIVQLWNEYSTATSETLKD